jgi:ADP-ribosyl-[dinitrogen reductase] hydrolase
VAPTLTPQQLDRAIGALVGLAIGDALGAPYEFTAGTSEPRMVGGGGFGWEPSEWTDDTQMAICIAEEAAKGSLDPIAVGQRFLNWYHDHPKDVGVQTSSVLGSVTSPDQLTAAAAERFQRLPNNSAGNGSLMRTAAVALAHLGDDDAIVKSARAISNLTHGDPLAAEACILWCIAIDRAIRFERHDGIYDGLDLLEPEARDRWGKWLHEAERGDASEFRHNGFVVPALQVAHWACRGPEMADEDRMACVFAQHALARVISVGGDTDTTAAIAGSLLGARFGVSAFPLEWTSILHGWPGYDVRDLVRLAILAVDAADPKSKWPDVDSMNKAYGSKVGATALPLPEDGGVFVGGFTALAEAQRFDVIVSLCRVGKLDTPGPGIRVAPRLIDIEGTNANLEFQFSDLAKQIGAWRDDGKTVLIHCVQGQRRTPAVAAAYLAEHLGISGTEAWERAEAVLPGALVNRDFMQALTSLWGS